MNVMKLIALMCLALVSCMDTIPKPCDPEIANAAMLGMATVCRTQAERNCPGYSELDELDKLACPGVSECLAKIESVEVSCHGN